MSTIYTDGQYLETTQTWHSEDSPWKADQIFELILRNRLQPKTVAEIGCGAGVILEELARKRPLSHVQFSGYDISQQAIDLAKTHERENVRFHHADLLAAENHDRFDLLLAIDVFEHVKDYISFIENLKPKAEFKIFHIPLDLHVSSVLRNSFAQCRYTLGHLHYFTAESAMATLKDAGYDIVDSFYTNAAFGLFREHPSLRRAVANVPRWVCSKISVPLSARLFGGYSLIVLAT